jgi:hypothetical protein
VRIRNLGNPKIFEFAFPDPTIFGFWQQIPHLERVYLLPPRLLKIIRDLARDPSAGKRRGNMVKQ